MRNSIDEVKAAIINVILKRRVRGASKESIVRYLRHLKNVWKNDAVITDFLNKRLETWTEKKKQLS